jgi:hypothetical protein
MIWTSQHHTSGRFAPLEGPARSAAPSASVAVHTRRQDETAGERQAYYAWHLAQDVQRYHQLLAQQQAMLRGAAPSERRALPDERRPWASTEAPRPQGGTPHVPGSPLVS